ncbi:hypothetical protein ACROYT_G041112 [Oculina patagonica]
MHGYLYHEANNSTSGEEEWTDFRDFQKPYFGPETVVLLLTSEIPRNLILDRKQLCFTVNLRDSKKPSFGSETVVLPLNSETLRSLILDQKQ